jgi:hypothetical protein
MSADESSFLSRWSRRKAQSRDALPLPAALTVPLPVTDTPPAQASAVAAVTPAPTSAPACTGEPASPEPQPAPAPTLEDVALLTPQSDYARFVARDVAPEVKNAAMKKLFTDPRFNVMDGLDVYTGDFNTPDPLPAGMLRQMVQSQLLGLFDDEEKKDDPAAAARTPALTPEPPEPTPATAPLSEAPLLTEPACHENADLQLQPDDVAGCAGPAPGAGQDAGCQH